MARKATILFLLIICLVGVVFCIMIWGFKKSFKDFGKLGDPPIAIYRLDIDETDLLKRSVERGEKETHLSFDTLSPNGMIFYKCDIVLAPDSITYYFRFKGDSSTWAKDRSSELLIVSIVERENNRSTDIESETRQKELLSLFEKEFLRNLGIEFRKHRL